MRIKICILALCLALLLSPTLVAPVQAAVGMSPLQGYVGTVVTISDLPGGSYVIKWDGADYKTGTASSGGSVQFTIAASAGGAHNVKVESPPGISTVLDSSFTILPSITISESSGTVGTSVTVEGTGFGTAETGIKITYEGTNVKTGINADDDGSWSSTFVVPSSTAGSHVVDAAGNTTDEDDVVDKTFTVSSKITISPVSGGVGTSVTVNGTAFDSAESGIEVTYDGKEIRTGLVANVKGSWSTTFVVPSSTKGSHPIDASGDTTSAADIPDATFTVLPGITVAPTSGNVGDEIDVKGSGFAHNESTIKITFDGVVVGSDLSADDNGNWMTSMPIPVGTSGEHTIDAYGNTTVAADVLDSTITIVANLVIRPKEGNIGDSINVTGTGFSNKKDYSISYGGETIVSGLITDPKGNLSASFEVPKGKKGDIQVIATDTEGVTASAVFAVETTPPAEPRIASPKDGGRVGYLGDVKVTFDWTDVSDPSGVYYILEVSSQSNFASTLLKIDKLTQSEYTLTEAEALSHGEYYWRVKAVDEAGNAGNWTAPALIKVGFMTVKSFVIIVASVIGVIILAAVLPRIIRKILRMKTSA